MSEGKGDNVDKPAGETAGGKNYIDRLTLLADPYIRHIKYGFYVVGTVGVILVLKSIHTTKVIRSVQDIPKEFIQKHIKLQGEVKSVDQYGILQIRHLPIINTPSWLSSGGKHDSTLCVKLACIDVTLSGCKWLHNNVVDRKVWFQTLSVESSTDSIIAAVYKQQYFVLPKKCINKDLTRLGLARVSHLSPQEVSNISEFQNRLLVDLIKLENKAMKKCVGVWADKNSAKSKITYIVPILKTVISAPIKLVQGVAKLIRLILRR